MKEGLIWQRRKLSNGLRVLLYPRGSANTTQIGVAIKYGANLDPDLTSGRSHFLEHMVGGGSDKRITLSRKIEQLGGFHNFSTNHEYTYSLVDIVPEKITKAAQLLSDLLFDSNFDQDKFNIERKRILNELYDIFDNPNEEVNHTLRKCLFKTHPIRREILGSKKSLDSLLLEDIVEAHKSYYIPSNMILVLTGKFTEKDRDTILNNFLDRNSSLVPRQRPYFQEKSKSTRKKTKTKSGLIQAYINMGARTVSSIHPDAHSLDLIETILGDGFSSRLYIEVCEKLALSYSISTSNQCGLDYGYFNIACSTKLKDLELAIQVIQKEIENLCSEKVEEKELRKAKNIIKGDVLRVFDNPTSLPELLASCEIKYETESAVLNYLRKIEEVSSKDVNNVANKYLNHDMFSISILSPKK